jgi:hypothetical protein
MMHTNGTTPARPHLLTCTLVLEEAGQLVPCINQAPCLSTIIDNSSSRPATSSVTAAAAVVPAAIALLLFLITVLFTCDNSIATTCRTAHFTA